MIKQKTFGLLALVAALGVAGCGNKNTGPASNYQPKAPPKVEPYALAAGQEPTLFPFVEGNQWVYTVEASAQDASGREVNANADLTFKMGKITEKPDGSREALIDIYRDDKAFDQQIWRMDSKGLYQVSIGLPPKTLKFDPPQPVISFPATVGGKFSWTGKGPISGGTVVSSLTGEILDPEEVYTGMGDKSALTVKQTQKWTDKGSENQIVTTSHWVPKLGLVRMWQEVQGDQAVGATKIVLKTATLK